MKTTKGRVLTAVLAAFISMFSATLISGSAHAADTAQIDVMANASLDKLYAENGSVAELSKSAVGLLIFPEIVKAGLGVGGEVGDGVLRIGDAADGYYRTLSLSVGWQAGFQTYGYVIMFMTQEALDNFKSKEGFKLGVDGSVAFVDAGATVDVDTTSIKADTIGIVFDESGLMANATVKGSKITRLDD